MHDPGSTPLGERVREILLHAREIPLAENTQALLFSAARAQLVRDVVAPALAAGSVVILDRFFDSTLAYQGAGHGADRAGLDAITTFAVGAVRPDRTFLLDVPVDVAAGRRARADGRTWDRFEADAQAFHQRVRDGYLRLAAAEPGRFVVISADRDKAAVAEDIRREVEPLLGTLRAP
ncbi:MAG: dTMP kinase [Candidatus Limnocylindrales bacterium]